MGVIYPWQLKAWEHLTNQKEKKETNVAWLFTGPNGVGKSDFAYHLSQWMICGSSDQREACGQCKSCHLFLSQNHPDFFKIEPINKSRVITVEQIRTLIDGITQTPKIAKKQVVLINLADRMNLSSANALLKILEEPAGNVSFLLVTDRIDQLPITIVSRCRRLNLAVENKNEALKWLIKEISDPSRAKFLLHLSNGAPLLALEMHNNQYLEEREKILAEIEALFYSKKLSIEAAEVLLKLNVSYFFQIFVCFVFDLLQIKSGVKNQFLINQDRLNHLKKIVDCMKAEKVESFYAKLLSSRALYFSQTNFNAQLLLEDILIDWSLL